MYYNIVKLKPDIIVADECVIVCQSRSYQQLYIGDALPLYCVASNHSLSMDYDWFNGEEDIGVSGPVLYVSTEGSYKCKVTDGNDRTCTSQIIEVSAGETQETGSLVEHVQCVFNS